mgnify:CR=1 FL=1
MNINYNSIKKITFFISILIGLSSNVKSQNIYFGDLHTHSNLSFDSNPGNLDSLYKSVRDTALLNFVCFTDHDWYSNETFWTISKQKANQYYQPGVFVTFIGYEFTKPRYEGGHRVVLYPGNTGERFSATVTSFDSLLIKVKRLHGLINVCHPDHESYYAYKEFRDPTVQKNIEMVGWSRYRSEYYGNPNPQPGQKKGYSVQDWLQFKEPIGFVGISDDHYNHPGRGCLTAIIADSLTRQDLFEAMNKRHNYATSGAKIKLSFTCNGYMMGDSIFYIAGHPLSFNGSVAGTAPIQKIELIKNGLVIWFQNFTNARVDSVNQISFNLNQAIDSTSYYYLRVTQTDSHMAWSSPIFIYSSILTSVNIGTDPSKDKNDKVFSMYPNPTNASINLSFEPASINRNFHINVINILGESVINEYVQINANARTYNLDLLNLVSGVYYVVMNNNEVINKSKFILVK